VRCNQIVGRELLGQYLSELGIEGGSSFGAEIQYCRAGSNTAMPRIHCVRDVHVESEGLDHLKASTS
jgi:hypothetical protein